MDKVLVSWSGGKDSAMALYQLQNSDYEIDALLTTITRDYDRISMHGVRSVLLERQAQSLGIPLEKVYISKHATNEEYEAKMKDVMLKYRDRGVVSVVFGDIFLEDVRRYREKNLAKIGMNGIFPLWKKDTRKLAFQFIKLGFKAIVAMVDTKFLDGSFVGREYNEEFLNDLPGNVDPCGENGEFHSFVYAGPIFQDRVSFKIGRKVLRENRFYYVDLVPV